MSLLQAGLGMVQMVQLPTEVPSQAARSPRHYQHENEDELALPVRRGSRPQARARYRWGRLHCRPTMRPHPPSRKHKRRDEQEEMVEVEIEDDERPPRTPRLPLLHRSQRNVLRLLERRRHSPVEGMAA